MGCQKGRPNAGRQDKKLVQQLRWEVMGNNVLFPNTYLCAMLFKKKKKATVLSPVRGFLAGWKLPQDQDVPIGGNHQVCGLHSLPSVLPPATPCIWTWHLVLVVSSCRSPGLSALAGSLACGFFSHRILTPWSLPALTPLPCLPVARLPACKLVPRLAFVCLLLPGFHSPARWGLQHRRPTLGLHPAFPRPCASWV